MQYRLRPGPLLLVIMAFLLLPWSAALAGGEDDCVAGLYRAASKFQQCEIAAGPISSISSEDWQNKLLRCRAKYAAAWPRLQAKHSGTSCDQARFIDNGNGTVRDNLTRLVWETKTTGVDGAANYSDPHDVDNVYALSLSAVAHDGDGAAFTDFLNGLNSTGFAGQHDWRVPTRLELHSILATNAADCGAPPCVADPLFLPAPAANAATWSSTAYHNYPGNAWVVYMSGHTDADQMDEAQHVRAVRGGL